MINFLHNYSPEPILLKLGPLSIHWYGFLMVVGGLLGFFLIYKLNQKYKVVDPKFLYDLLLWFVVGAVIGARIYYVIYAWDFYKDNWLDVFKIWEGGLAIHGIMIAGFIATFILCKIKKQRFLEIADLAVIGLVTAQVIGRVGNYFNQEIFGRPTDLAWGIPIDVVNRPAEFIDATHFHPTFLYESFGNLLILGILVLVYCLLKKHFHDGKHESAHSGNIFLLYLVLYSIQRFSLEFLRQDYSPLVFGIRWAQVFSGVIVIIAGLAFVYRKIRNTIEIQ